MKRFLAQVFTSILFFLLVFPARVVFATELSSIYATPTTHLVSESANYTFYLTLDGSASWSSGETLSITFPAEYALTSFTEDDIDVAHNGVDVTTAATCAGSEEMGVSISGNVVTFEMCAGDGGSVASSAVVQIEMGLNASSSGTGSHQIINPDGVGSYFISMSGTFGSDGSVIVPITESSSSGVSVTVPAVSSGDTCTVACGGGGGGGSTPAPTPTPDPDPDPDPTLTPDPDPTPDPAPVDSTPDPATPEDSSTSSDQGTSSPNADADSDTSGSALPLGYGVGVSAKDIPLTVVDATVEVLPQTTATLEVLIDNDRAAAVYIELIGIQYPLIKNTEGIWTGSIPIGGAGSTGTIVIEDDSGIIVSSPLAFDVIAGGFVYEIIDGQAAGVEGVDITVYDLDGSLWDAERYGQSARSVTRASGYGFGWYVPNGTYVIRLEKEGYEVSETVITVAKNILAPSLLITRSQEESIPIDSEQTGRIESILDGAKELPQVTATFLQNSLAALQDLSSEEAVLVGAPVLVGIATVATFAAEGSQLLWLLYSFFSQPFLFFTRKKKRNTGTVYNSVTKLPIDLVVVRAYEVLTNRLVKTVVTNNAGTFFLKLSVQGTYRLEATKQGFVFPSVYLQGVQEDGVFSDVYTGQDIIVGAQADALQVAIPLDPEGSLVSAKVLTWQRTKRRIALALSPISVCVTLGTCFFYPSLFTIGLFILQIGLYAVTWRIAHKHRKTSWGIVYDETSRRPVGNVMIRLFEPKYNKLVDSVLSDANGRYVFALGPNEYYATFTKKGYIEATVRPIDYTHRKEMSLFGINLPLRRDNGKAHE